MLTHVIRNQEWLDANSDRHYPLTAESSGVSTDGSFTLPEDFLVACQIFLPYYENLELEHFFLYKLISDPVAGASLTFGGLYNSEPVEIATVDISRRHHHPFKVYPVKGLNAWSEAVGTAVINRFDSLDQQPAGEFVFTPETARLESDAIRFMVRSVPYIRIRNGQSVSPPIYSPIIFKAGYNCRIDSWPLEINNGTPLVQIVINAIEGEGLNKPCTTGLEDPPVRFIGSAAPTNDGNLLIVGSDCIKVEPIEHGLRLENVCAEKCCGQEELELLTHEAERLDKQLANLEYFVSRLEREVTTLRDALMSSRLGEGGCFACE